LGLRVLLASLAALFIATLFCGWYFRDTGAAGKTLPSLPLGIWLTTLLLGVVSVAVESGLRRGRAAAEGTASRAGVQLSLAFGVAFLLAQGWNWSALLEQETGKGVHPMYAFNFYLMTALHATHILGGIIYGVLVLGALGDTAEVALQKVRNLAHYWHFLAGTWVAILLNLYAIRIENPEDSFLGPVFLGTTGLLLLAVLVYQGIAVRLLWLRGEKAFACFSLLLPIAFLHIWARGEELGTQRMALHWGVLQALLLIALMFTGTLYLGSFAGNFEQITY
jgi:heme/copper-type cytochrome/quinol oxidase subunit 3